ncbi:MAG TPA: hypothetical protein VLF93_05510, partial [Candidatus Saccharimonadales bacterium]|nr:hypothetical protein [Candidatus Saccharimonadales bacterium]
GYTIIFGTKPLYTLIKTFKKKHSQIKFISLIHTSKKFLSQRHIFIAFALFAITTVILYYKPQVNSFEKPEISYPPANWKISYQNSMSKDDGEWANQNYNASGSATFWDDIYMLSAENNSYYSVNTSNDYKDFAYQVQMITANGGSSGIIFRATINPDGNYNYYYFWIDSKGNYGFQIYKDGNYLNTLRGGYTPMINQGRYEPNTLAVLAQKNVFKLYINKQLIDTVTDNENINTHGRIGMRAGVSAGNDYTSIYYSKVIVWTPQ